MNIETNQSSAPETQNKEVPTEQISIQKERAHTLLARRLKVIEGTVNQYAAIPAALAVGKMAHGVFLSGKISDVLIGVAVLAGTGVAASLYKSKFKAEEMERFVSEKPL